MRIARIDVADPATARRLHAVHMAAYAQEARLLDVARFPPLERSVHDLPSSSDVFLGAFEDDELAGAIGISRDDDDGDRSATNIDSLVVMPAFQRRGIATALLAAATADHGRGELTVQTAVKNAPALALYAKAGFVEVDRWSVDGGLLELVRLRRGPASGS